jgi:hypothetical protein
MQLMAISMPPIKEIPLIGATTTATISNEWQLPTLTNGGVEYTI